MEISMYLNKRNKKDLYVQFPLIIKQTSEIKKLHHWQYTWLKVLGTYIFFNNLKFF